ncbi:nitrous oxide-stimulated promoter family protein [Thermovibrio ammonificans]
MSVIEREKETIRRMVEIYCWRRHGSRRGELCPECEKLLDYAFKRLDLCPFGEEKPTCKKCPVHCYSPDMRRKVKEVMRFSGPRLLIYDPFGWLRHEIKERFRRPGLLKR